MMPSNAFNTLLTVVHISDFQFIPVESFIKSLENGMGIQSEEYVFSENFKDFEYNSTSVMINLQLIFVFMLVLLLLPFVILILYGVFFWSAKCKTWLTRVANGIFYNTYIRFLLES